MDLIPHLCLFVGAYYLLENNEESKQFEQSNIEDILSKKSRLVK